MKGAVLMLAAVASAGPVDWAAWKYRKAIPVTAGDGLAVVKLDRDVYAAIGSRYYKLRVYRDKEEVPFVFGSMRSTAEVREKEVEEVFDQSIVPGEGLRFTVHRRHLGLHDKIDIFTDLKNFRNKVRVETSQDGVHWAVVRADGAIFNFSQDGREFSSTRVAYPASRQPYIRTTIFGWMKNGVVTGAAVDHRDQEPEMLEVFAEATPRTNEDLLTKSTVAQIDLGMEGLPVERLRIESSSPQFQRAASVETSDDGQNWSYASGGTIARLPGSEFTEEWLTVPAGGAHRYFRIRIYNRDDKPIQVGRVQAEGPSQEVRFLASTQGSYWLYYGGPGPELEAMPQYDLANVLAHQALTEHSFTLGEQEANPAYRAPAAPRKPWSEQHPGILYTVLGGAVLALGVATLRFMVRLRAPV